MKILTDKELDIMNALWKTKRAYLKEIIAQMPEPKPAYTTVSTMISRLVDKDHVGFELRGRDKEYFARLKKSTYFSNRVKHTITNYFDQSPAQFASFFTRESDLSLEELEDLKKLVDQQIARKKDNL